jgi:hypothetical protein
LLTVRRAKPGTISQLLLGESGSLAPASQPGAEHHARVAFGVYIAFRHTRPISVIAAWNTHPFIRNVPIMTSADARQD